MALGANFSMEADSHLVCIQNDDGNYQTQAINIQNKPRKGQNKSNIFIERVYKFEGNEGSILQGSHPTWKTWKTWNFVIFFSRPGKCLEFGQKVVKAWNFNLKPGKTWHLQILCFNLHFQDVIYKNNSDLLLCHIYIININTDSKPNCHWISLLLPGNNLENTWNFVSQEKWEPCIMPPPPYSSYRPTCLIIRGQHLKKITHTIPSLTVELLTRGYLHRRGGLIKQGWLFSVPSGGLSL